MLQWYHGVRIHFSSGMVGQRVSYVLTWVDPGGQLHDTYFNEWEWLGMEEPKLA